MPVNSLDRAIKLATMMRAINIFIFLYLFANVAYPSSSIYGSSFDYRKARPARAYFSGKNREQVTSYCKNKMLGTMDLAACSQFRYEVTVEVLDKRILEVEKILQADDKDNRSYDQPSSLPFFKKSQSSWEIYRDNNCYTDVYSVGQASLHFVDFWDCMTRITENRLKELSKGNGDE
jgi:uncharacterized protein YecT (DUF1311 family)